LVWDSSSYNIELNAKISYSFPKNCAPNLHKLSIMDRSTETLNLCLGGFPGSYVRFIWLNDKLYHKMDTVTPEEEVRLDQVLYVTTPSKKDWEEFWLTVDELKVLSWEKNILIVKFVMALSGN